MPTDRKRVSSELLCAALRKETAWSPEARIAVPDGVRFVHVPVRRLAADRIEELEDLLRAGVRAEAFAAGQNAGLEEAARLANELSDAREETGDYAGAVVIQSLAIKLAALCGEAKDNQEPKT
jgi:hypothetical protein